MKTELWDQADCLERIAAMQSEATFLETALAALGKSVPARPKCDRDDLLNDHDALEAHVAQLRQMADHSQVKPAKAAPAPTSGTRPGTASLPTAQTAQRKLTASEKCILAKGGKLPEEKTGTATSRCLAAKAAKQ